MKLNIVFCLLIATATGCTKDVEEKAKIPNKTVWETVKQEAFKYKLNPEFVYAIAFAESSFRPLADSGKARGIMQISKAAWDMVSNDSYEQAWIWRRNIEVGTAYLALNKMWLEKEEQFSYINLAASYRHGINRLKDIQFDLNQLPTSTNETYKLILDGIIPEIPKT